MPFGGYKQSGIGRELGEYALEQYVSLLHLDLSILVLSRIPNHSYTAVKAVHINLGHEI